MVKDCYIRLWDYEAGVEIFRYDLKVKFTTEDAVEFGRFVRVANSWEFIATEEKYNGSLNKFIELFT
jgi:stress response protein SCP2